MAYAARQRAAGADMAEVSQQSPPLSWPRCIDNDVAEVTACHLALVIEVLCSYRGRRIESQGQN